MQELKTDVLIVGGGTGGVAAAMAAASLRCKVILTEETDWLGGQLTSQAVPPDENPWIEHGMCTARYTRFREGVRQYYRDHYPLSAAARANPRLNPGHGNVSRLCHEPRVALAVIDHMLAADRSAGRIDVRVHHKPVAAATDGDRVTAVTLHDSATNSDVVITADYILDATELGDLLALAKVEYVSGAESQRETGEPHALTGDADPDDVQAFTWCFPMAYDPTPGADHTIDEPDQYDFWRDYDPKLTPAWPGKFLAWEMTHPITLDVMHHQLDPTQPEKARTLWHYRRIVGSINYEGDNKPHEVTLVNWPSNDYIEGNIIDASPDDAAKHLHDAKQQALSLMYWLQTDAPRPDGGQGWPGLYPRPDMTGTADGIAKYPYIRESRRIRAKFTVTENHVGTEARKAMGSDAAEQFADSVGIGCYRIDLHPSSAHRNYVDISSRVFQIPLGALIPQRVTNLLPACKNLGVTHITNGCYRLHPVEWNIGEAAGLLAAHCVVEGTQPHAVHEDNARREAFQQLCMSQGFVLEWPRPDGV